MKSSLTLTLRNKKEQPIAVLHVREFDNECCGIGMSICSESDTFNPHRGIQLAKKRVSDMAKLNKNVVDGDVPKEMWHLYDETTIIRERAWKQLHSLKWEHYKMLNRLFMDFMGTAKADVIDLPFNVLVITILRG